jgi:hypothetical protein
LPLCVICVRRRSSGADWSRPTPSQPAPAPGASLSSGTSASRTWRTSAVGTSGRGALRLPGRPRVVPLTAEPARLARPGDHRAGAAVPRQRLTPQAAPTSRAPGLLPLLAKPAAVATPGSSAAPAVIGDSRVGTLCGTASDACSALTAGRSVSAPVVLRLRRQAQNAPRPGKAGTRGDRPTRPGTVRSTSSGSTSTPMAWVESAATSWDRPWDTKRVLPGPSVA